jgi:hypothetical protein
MFAVVVRETGDDALIQSSRGHLAGNVLPQVRRAPGILSATFTTDGCGRTLNLLVFEDEAHARDALERVRAAPRPEFMQLESADVAEVLAAF